VRGDIGGGPVSSAEASIRRTPRTISSRAEDRILTHGLVSNYLSASAFLLDDVGP
jgi:hypothetical protein